MWAVFTQKLILGQLSVSASANQYPGFSVRGTSTPNCLFHTIKRLMGYTKRLLQLKYGVLFHLKFKNLEFLKSAICCFSGMWKFRNLPLLKRRIYCQFNKIPVIPLLSLPMPKSVHVGPQLDNEVCSWFP